MLYILQFELMYPVDYHFNECQPSSTIAVINPEFILITVWKVSNNYILRKMHQREGFQPARRGSFVRQPCSLSVTIAAQIGEWSSANLTVPHQWSRNFGKTILTFGMLIQNVWRGKELCWNHKGNKTAHPRHWTSN